MPLDAIETDRSSRFSSFEEDPVLARVQASLASGGGDFSGMPISGPSSGGGTGQEIMMEMLANKTAEAPAAGGVTTAEGGESSALPWIVGGVAAAAGVGVGAYALGGGFADDPAKKVAAPAPAPETKAPAAKPAPQKTAAPTVPATKAEPSKPAASLTPEFGNGGLMDMLSKPNTDRNGNIVWSDASKPAKPATAPKPSPMPAKPSAAASTSAFRLQVTPLTDIPPPTPDEVAAGASLPQPMASTEPVP